MATKRSLYNVMEDRWFPGDRLPTPDELEQVINALDGIQEFLTGPIADGCIKVGNVGEASSVNFEQIARLVLWADNVRWTLSLIAEDAEKVSLVARESFPNLAHGFAGDGTPYNEHGNVEQDEWHEKLRNRLGFSHA